MNKNITKEDLIQKFRNIEGKKLGEIDLYELSEHNKAYVGYVFEKNILGYNPNSIPNKDIPHLDLEFKSTPVKIVKNKYIAKERLVLNIINYVNENWHDFYGSSFWRKNENLMIAFYEYLPNTPKKDLLFLKAILYSFPDKDVKIIRNDWKIISNRVLAGEAHKLSERDTMYLAACTKGANRKSVQNQPYSSVLAKQRAYSLKASFMTSLFHENTIGKKNNQLINEIDMISEEFNIQEYVLAKINPFIGKTRAELLRYFEINAKENHKAINSLIMKKIMEIAVDLEKTEEFQKARVKTKTIRLELNGQIREHMSFPAFKFSDIAKTCWEDSELKILLEETIFMFVVFKKTSKNENDSVLSFVKFWSMSEEDILKCKEFYVDVKNIVNDGVVLMPTRKGIKNNLPSSKDHPIMHVRPHAQNSYDCDVLPDGQLITKQSFWINKSYILKTINSK